MQLCSQSTRLRVVERDDGFIGLSAWTLLIIMSYVALKMSNWGLATIYCICQLGQRMLSYVTAVESAFRRGHDEKVVGWHANCTSPQSVMLETMHSI